MPGMLLQIAFEILCVSACSCWLSSTWGSRVLKLTSHRCASKAELSGAILGAKLVPLAGCKPKHSQDHSPCR